MEFEAFNEQQQDLAEIDREEYGFDEEEEQYKHRLIFDTEKDAKKAKKYLESHGFTDVYYSYDDDSNNYDLGFTSDHRLTGDEENDILHNCPDCTYSFSIFAE